MSKSESLNTFLTILITFFLLFILRLPDFSRPECSADEGQWVASANTFLSDPCFWFKHFQARDFARTFTVLPLTFIKLFSSNISYANMRIVALIMWLVFIYYYIKINLNLFSKKTTYYSLIIIVLIISTFDTTDFIAYNSEIVALPVLIACFFYFMMSCEHNSGIYPILVGILLPILLLTKDQTIPITGTFGIIILTTYYLQRKTKEIILFGAGVFITSLIISIPLFIYDSFDDVMFQFSIMMEYVNHPIEKPYTLKKKIYEFIKLLFHRELRINVFIFPSIVLFALYIFRKKISINKRQLIFFSVTLVLFFATCTSVYLPSQFYNHYSIFFIFPCSILLAYSVFFIEATNTSKVSFALFISIIALAFFVRKIYPNEAFAHYEDNCEKQFQNKFSDYIIKQTDKNNRLAIWGWNTSYYVETQLLMGNRYIYPQYIIYNFPQKNEVLKQYIDDLIKLKPKIFLELIGNDQFVFKDTSNQSLKHFPELYAVIKTNYELDIVNGNEKLYVLKNE